MMVSTAMTDGGSDRVQELFVAALEIATDARDTWLVQQCGDDHDLLQEVRSLLDHDSLDCDPAVNHQREFAAATLTDKGMATIREGALAMAYTAIDLAEGNLWAELGEF